MSDPAKNITADSAAILKPARPYTEYNIFFQLEREYILQVLLSVEPTYEPSEIFHPEHTAHYQGPYLPSRYQDIVLPNDWYIPGKARRRKRRHRKSHGAIGFHELSLKIAKAWSNVDDETRTFCACLSDIGMLQYKRDMQKYNMQDSGSSNRSRKKTTKKTTTASKTSKSIKKKTLMTTSPATTPKSMAPPEDVECHKKEATGELIMDAQTLSNVFCNAQDQDTATTQQEYESSSSITEVLQLMNSSFDQDVGLCLLGFQQDDNGTTAIINQEESTSNHPNHDIFANDGNLSSTMTTSLSATTTTRCSSIVSRSNSSVDVTSASSSPSTNNDIVHNPKDSFVDMEDSEIWNLWELAGVVHGRDAPSDHVCQDSTNKTAAAAATATNAYNSKENNIQMLDELEDMEHMRYMLSRQQSQLQQLKMGRHRNFIARSA